MEAKVNRWVSIPGSSNPSRSFRQKCRVVPLIIWVFTIPWFRPQEFAGPSGNPFSPEKKQSHPDSRVILFFGDSLTAGFGVSSDEAFPALIQKKIQAAGWNMKVINAGLSGETTAGGVRRIEWVLNRKIDVLVLALGGNDGLRGIPLEATRQNLQEIIDRARGQCPQLKIVVAGMRMPSNLGPAYTASFQAIFPAIAKKNGAILIPFLLEGVGGRPELNQADGIHPTPEGHRIIARNVWKVLEPLLMSLAMS